MNHVASPEDMGGINLVHTPRDYLPDYDKKRKGPPPSPRVYANQDNDDDDDTNEMLPEGRAYSQRPYLVLVIVGIRVAHMTRREYDRLTPMLRKLADACMRLEKHD